MGEKVKISIHAPRKGERRHTPASIHFQIPQFQSTLPARGSDPPACPIRRPHLRISIHAPRKGERHRGRYTAKGGQEISIHAPRKGERPNHDVSLISPYKFQSTLPARGSDDKLNASITREQKFQSTLPARGSDYLYPRLVTTCPQISIHAPRKGERPNGAYDAIARDKFQSTLPARGSDIRPKIIYKIVVVFQSTLPARGSDVAVVKALAADKIISIHAPRKGERRDGIF